MNLPPNPGLSRRLAYGNYIRNKHKNNYQTYENYQIYQNYQIYEMGNAENRNTEDDDTILEENLHNFSYENLVGLKDVETGLSLKKLIQNSTIEINYTPFFCSICQVDTHCDIEISRNLSCNHKFHIGCIEYWLQNHKTCPVCRYNIDN